MFAYCGDNPVNQNDPTGEYGLLAFLAVIAYNATILIVGCDTFLSPSLEDHYGRNSNNIKNMPDHYDPGFFDGWQQEKAWCHQFTSDDNWKLVSPDGHYEAIFNSAGKLVTDERDYGTYNYNSPKEDPIGHMVSDVVPWIVHGNSANDKTTVVQRVAAFTGIKKVIKWVKSLLA